MLTRKVLIEGIAIICAFGVYIDVKRRLTREDDPCELHREPCRSDESELTDDSEEEQE